jgi:hypothetical protein
LRWFCCKPKTLPPTPTPPPPPPRAPHLVNACSSRTSACCSEITTPIFHFFPFYPTKQPTHTPSSDSYTLLRLRTHTHSHIPNSGRAHSRVKRTSHAVGSRSRAHLSCQRKTARLGRSHHGLRLQLHRRRRRSSVSKLARLGSSWTMS